MECLALSCDGILAESPNAPDGEYILNFGGSPDHPWSAYCADMSSGSPTEYLSLVNTWFGENAATFQPGGAATGTAVMTSYTKLRIDSLTLEIDLDDARFTTTQGSISFGGNTVTSMPYGVAMGCNPNWQAGANIDLRMTPFRFDGQFLAGASVTASSGNQLFSILGGSAACDVNGPSGISQQPYNGNAGGRMQLTYDK